MSWLNLNQSLNSLKGQITNFASEVLSEVPGQDTEDNAAATETSVKELEEKCHNQELEIASLKSLTAELEATLQSERFNRKNGVKEKEEESSWYWDPPPQPVRTDADIENVYKTQIKELQEEISTLKERYDIDPRQDNDDELEKLREENKNLTTNLEDLDSQHQLAMERLLSLKKELQKNFEVLRQEHEDLKYNNDEYANEIKDLQAKIAEKDKDLETLKTAKADYDTLHHKYMNLERVHDLLRENAEKFQEENQELHEEIFKLQEQVTKLEHEVEIVTKHSELSETVPRDRYEELLKELNDLKDSRNSNHQHVDEINIDDNAKSVIETLKRELHEVKHRLAQKESDAQSDNKVIKSEKIMQFYNKYVNFEIPVDYLGEVPSSGENIVVFKLESVFKTLNSFKKDIDKLNHKLSEKKLNIDHMQTQIDDLTTENDFLTNDLHHTERELEEMKKNNDFLISEIAALKNTSKLEPIIETHEDNLAKLETELADSNKLNKNFESKIQRIEKELEAVKHEKVLLQTSLADLKEKYTLMLSELDMFKAKTKDVEDLEKTVNIASEEMVKNCTHEIHELKKRLNASNAKNEQLSIDVHIAENDKVLLTQEIDNLKQSLKHDAQSSSKSKDDHDGRLPEVVEDSLEPQARAASINLLETSTKYKNITTALKEVEEIKLEKAQVQAQLDIAKDENTLLKESISQLNTALDHIREQERNLLIQIDDLNKSRQAVLDKEQVLQGTIEKLNDKVATQEILTMEIGKLKEENIHLTQMRVHLEAELLSTDAKITQLNQEFEKVLCNVNEKDSLIDALNTTITENNSKIIYLKEIVSELENNLVSKNNEIIKLQKSLEDVTQVLNQTNQQSNQSIEAILLEKESLKQQLFEHNVELKNKTDEISALNNTISEVERNRSEFKILADEKDKEIKELRQSIVEISDKLKNVDHTTNADDYAILLKEKEAIQNQVVDLQNNITVKQEELNEIKAKHDLMEKACIEYKVLVENTTAEKAELINLVNLKHNESLQYHNEIQRLNHVLLEQNTEMKKFIEEKNQQMQNDETCPTCENLRMTLREKDEIIKTLNQNNSVFEKHKADLLNANESLRMLTEKCDGLEKNLQIQLENVKTLAAEKIQLSEQHDNATRELERLRRHLVEMEDNYTQELMTSEQKLTECQARLQHVEERAKQSSTVYTSNSIRANQEVETLRNQIKLLEKQREEVQARLGEAEDARGRSEAALTNLQVVLEQFQLDKERDIHTATEKIRNKMEDLKKENDGLQKGIEKLNVKLQESLAGLQAATRLGDQLETKTAQINDLKEQVKTLQTSVGAAEERYYKAISNQQDKVDKNLVKNLVLNFVLTAGNNTNKTQILRVLSTVLDFNQQECRKLGLEKAPPADSLAAEFVKFLQDESKPRAPLPSMMGLTRSNTPSSRKSSTIGPSPIPSEVLGHKRNPSTGSNNLLFQNIDNVETTSQISIESDHRVSTIMDTGVNQTRNTQGAILKHVLKDM
ncbi:thyroid receptor-interacting protein 11 [Cydia splendana]|uniref:thyroid receptor-interacting protein 11 n=1 Tax=Cydia splendana TaxID=1100963 RepID=UPI0028F48073